MKALKVYTPAEIIERQVLDDLHGDASGFDAENVVRALLDYGYEIVPLPGRQAPRDT